MNILKHHFYTRDTLSVAGALLGKKLVRKYRGSILSGLICETEAYLGSVDSASHAFRGKTPRNAIMFGRSGRAYVYFIYIFKKAPASESTMPSRLTDALPAASGSIQNI
jgi:DNA-3-methyladenine glycosylase